VEGPSTVLRNSRVGVWCGAMRCPFCDHADTRVIDSRPADQGAAIRRRRSCEGCEQRFTTYERAQARLMVRKRSGVVEPFQADKLRRGLESALADRPVGDGAVDGMLETIVRTARSESPVVTSDVIGRAVLEALRAIDEVAYLRFASVYKDFQFARDFEAEMASLEAQEPEESSAPA